MPPKQGAGRRVIAVEHGSSFTTLVYLDGASVAKRLKLPAQQGLVPNLRQGLEKLGQVPDFDVSQVKSVVDASPFGEQVLLDTEVQVDEVGLILSEGHSHQLPIRVGEEAGRLLSLRNTVECRGRINSSGEEVQPLDEAYLREQVKRLGEVGVIVVSLLNSNLNSAHELRVKEIVTEERPGTKVTMTHEEAPGVLGVVRTLTTVAGAVLRNELKQRLSTVGEVFGTEGVLMAQGNGGVRCGVETGRSPVDLLGGSAAAAASHAGSQFGKDLIVLDVGGSTTDIGLVRGGTPLTRYSMTVGTFKIHTRGLAVKKVPLGSSSSVAVSGASAKVLRIETPEEGALSACQGGGSATLLDASLALGVLPRQCSLGGCVSPDLKAAKSALKRLAAALGFPSVEEAAEGAFDIANETLASAVRTFCTEKGVSPNGHALVAHGGAGPLHACAVAQLLGTWPVIVPPHAGAYSTLSAATGFVRVMRTASFARPLENVTSEDVTGHIRVLTSLVIGAAARAGAAQGRGVVLHAEALMRYKGQEEFFPIVISPERSEDFAVEWLGEQLDEAHKRKHGFAPSHGHEIVALRVAFQSRRSEFSAAPPRGTQEPPESARLGEQEFYFRQRKTKLQLYNRTGLLAGNRIEGPALVAEEDTATMVPLGCRAVVNDIGALVITGTGPPAIPGGIPPIITQSVVELTLQAALNEVQTAVRRHSASGLLKDAHSLNAVICAPNGEVLAGCGGSVVHSILRCTRLQPIDDGDVLLTADPETSDGAVGSLREWLMVTPINYESNRVGWVIVSGEVEADTAFPKEEDESEVEPLHDGLSVPPVRLYRKGVPNKDLFRLLLHQLPRPDFSRCDLQALVVGLQVARNRVQDMCSRLGVNAVVDAQERVLVRCREAVSKATLGVLTEGEASFEDYVCDNGQGGGPYKIGCKVKKDEGSARMVFDFSDTDAATESSVGALLNLEVFKLHAARLFLSSAGGPDAPINEGASTLFDVKVPVGSLLGPRHHPLNYSSQVAGRVEDVLRGVVAKLRSGNVNAAGGCPGPR
eukprot:Hpha_TRINITY_DN14112_c0_g3::TRINITY_DN14112_c0_g3_i1::g.11140::m.11140/K01469/OPLAH, OXP1, oplAH; 5-oxoprolinase (ATP-hydrolysing)